MKNLEKISEDLFNKIRGRFPSVTIGTEEGKVTDDPSLARFYDFDYKAEGNSLGRISVSIDEDKLSIMYTNNFVEDQSDTVRENWYSFLKELRSFAKKRLLDFDTRDITKSNLDRRDYKFLAKNNQGLPMSESKMFGTSNVSYQNIGSARLNIRHRSAVNPEQPASRTRNIDRIYIESPEGERFKYPYRHLAGARAMARHVAEGGNPYDDFGKHVVGLSEELNSLKKFKTYVNRSSVMAEGLSQYMDIIEGRAKEVKKKLESVQKPNGYAEVIENWESVVLEDVPEDVKTNWIDELTIRQFNEDLKDIFPYIYRLIGEGSRSQEITPDNFETALDEKETRQMKDPKKEMQVHKDGKVKTIDKDEWKRHEDMGYEIAESDSDYDVGDDIHIKSKNITGMYYAEKDGKIIVKTPKGLETADADDVEPVESEGNAYANAVRQAKKDGKEKGDEIDGPDGEEITIEQDQLPVTEYILSFYDRETGTFPRGETAVLTSIEKDYGESYIESAKQFIERVNEVYNNFQEGCGCEDEEQEQEDEEFQRMRHLAGI